VCDPDARASEGNWSPEAGGTGWLTLGEPGGTRVARSVLGVARSIFGVARSLLGVARSLLGVARSLLGVARSLLGVARRSHLHAGHW